MQELDKAALLAERLRMCLRFDETTPEESELEKAARDAANELELLVTHMKRLEKWKHEGEQFFERGGIGVAFAIGAWWADRPWRDRDA